MLQYQNKNNSCKLTAIHGFIPTQFENNNTVQIFSLKNYKNHPTTVELLTQVCLPDIPHS